MLSITVDGLVQEAQAGERLIDVINRSTSKIPQVCYHPQLGPIQTCDTSELDLNRSIAFELAARESRLIQDINEALGRIENGTYGQCGRCGKPLYEERLKAMPDRKSVV